MVDPEPAFWKTCQQSSSVDMVCHSAGQQKWPFPVLSWRLLKNQNPETRVVCPSACHPTKQRLSMAPSTACKVGKGGKSSRHPMPMCTSALVAVSASGYRRRTTDTAIITGAHSLWNQFNNSYIVPDASWQHVCWNKIVFLHPCNQLGRWR